MRRDTADGPFSVYVVDCFEIRTRVRTYESLTDATKRAIRIAQTMYAEMEYGAAVDITDGRGETISHEEIA